MNVGFLGFAAYVLGEVAANARERNKSQLELITNLVRDIQTAARVRHRAGSFPSGLKEPDSSSAATFSWR